MVARSAKAVVHVGRAPKLEGKSSKRSKVLWGVQGLLAVTFLFAGSSKLLVSAATLTSQYPLPGDFMRFIGVCEVLGALGLIFPALLRIRPGLTPLAGAGLAVIMLGATTVTVIEMSVFAAIIPFVIALLAASVAYGRSRPATPPRAADDSRTEERESASFLPVS